MSFYTFFPKLLNMSLTAGVVIVFVLLLRLVLRKAPKVISYALWGIVLFRLLCPVAVESEFSLFGFWDTPVAESGTLTSRIEYVPDHLVYTKYPYMASPVSGVDHVTGNVFPQSGEEPDADPLKAPMTIVGCVWIAGMLVMVLYAMVSYIRLRRKLITASLLRDNIYLADEIEFPFVMGLLRPKIYLPSSMAEQEQPYILMHEQHHIRRRDPVIKALAFLALCIHWFNPLVWVAFIMAGKDMEMSCDEAVVRKMGTGILADYTASLLSLATGKHIIAGMPLAFGEGDTKGRIRNLANWKKPTVWVILGGIFAGIALAVCLLTNPKQDSYSLRIVVPAGSQEEMVYADEEISPLGNYITVTCGDGLGDTAVSLKPVQVKTEAASGEPVYLTPGMPAKLEAEKGGWFQIGVNIQNDTDEDKIVYLNVKNVEVRISGEVVSDRITFETETYPEGPEEVYDVPVIKKTKTLSLNDVIILSQHGYDLTWSDFEQYDYLETGSGLYIRVYKIDELFELWIGGAGPYGDPMYPDSSPMYIYLILTDGTGAQIDIRDGGVEAFIEEHRSEVLLTKAINNAILDRNKPAKSDGLYHCASFTLLEQEEICPEGEPSTPTQVTVYGFALYQAYGYSGGAIRERQGSHIPVAITFEVKDSGYVLTEYWEPGDGSYYEKDIREKFPDTIEEEALNTPKYILAQKQNCYTQAVEYGSVDTDAVIDHLFEVIESSPSQSSDPGAYIGEHPIEYRELTYYGQYTLRYCFEKFLQGDQTGLRGQIMALVCKDIMLVWGEWYDIDQDLMNGQGWFDAFKNIAEWLSEQHQDEDMARNYPGVGLLLQMMGE